MPETTLEPKPLRGSKGIPGQVKGEGEGEDEQEAERARGAWMR